METNPQNPALNEPFATPANGSENIPIPVKETVLSDEQEQSEPVTPEVTGAVPDPVGAAESVVQEDTNPLQDAAEQPETAENPSPEAEKLPEAAEDALPEAEKLPEAAEDTFLEAEKLPEVAEDAFLEAEKLPGAAEDALPEAEKLPETAEDAFLEAEKLPETAEDAFLEAEELPEAAEDAFLEAEKLPEVAEDALLEAEKLPEDAEDDISPEEQPQAEEDILSKYTSRTRKELVVIFEQLLQATTDEAAETLRREADLIKSIFYKLLMQEQENAGTDASDAHESSVSDELERKFKKLYNEYKQRRAHYSQLVEQEKEENLARKLAIIDELKALLDKQENLTQTFPAFRALQQHWRETGQVPLARVKDVWETYQYHVERFYDYVKINKELRDLDLKRNLEARTLLCEKAEELLLEPSVINAFVKLQRYHEQWREIGPVARELREQVWERFKNASNAINKKHQDYFDQQKEQQKKNLAAKIALCEKAEEMAGTEVKGHHEWSSLTNELEKLQKVWKTIGFAKKGEDTKLYKRFRKACDTFYTVKREFYSRLKAEIQENLTLKLALLEEAEALKDSDDWKKTADQFISLQKQWKEIGPAGRAQTEELWKRFRAACDYFFERRHKHFSSVDSQYDNNLTLKKAIIQEIEAFVPSRNAGTNLNALKDFQRRWTEIGYVPIKDKEYIQTAYRAALDKQFSALNMNTSEKKILRFQNRIEDIQHSSDKPNRIIRTERDKLVQQLRQLESDVALWENNIGFFAKSKNAEALMADVNNKIAAARDEIKTIEAKIKLIDQQYE
jgi:hypothetical protein